MLRGLRHHAAVWGARFISIGGRRTRGGFSHSLGKHPQVKQGVTDGVPRRIPGTTKVTYTNKKGRTFTFSVPVAEITHPQVNLTNAVGSWREIDTSYCDLGDIEDDMPSPMEDYLREEPDKCSVAELHETFLSFCKEYVLMDTGGMKSLPFYGELNVGPDIANYDRRMKRKRHWLAIRHRFEDLREIIWPEDGATLSVHQMLDVLLWLEAASTFCVRKPHPADLVDKNDFLPLNLHREVEIVARYASKDPTLFGDSSSALELFVACAALCANHKVPFSLFFTAGDVTGSDWSCVLTKLPSVTTTFGAIRIMSVIAADIDVYRFSDTSGVVQRPDTMRGLSQLMSIEAFGAKDALENVAESELCTLMRFCVNVKEQNVAFFLHSAATDNEEEVSFLARYRQVSHVALTRCKYLLYRLDGPRTQVMSENGYIPLVDLQQHAERTNKDTIVHYNLGIRSAQGLRRVALGAQSSAQLAELIDRLEVSDSRLSGNTLLVDMVHHLSHKAAAGKVSLTLREVNTVLPLLARMRREQPTGMMDSRFNRLLAVIETAIGTAMQEKRSVEELVDLVEGLAACDILPTTFKQVEMVLLRLMLTQTCSVVHVTRILRALSSLLKSGVSQVLLQSAASHATDFAKSNGSVGSSEAEQLIELLEALGACKYEALPGLIVFCRANCLTEDVQLCLNGRCGYASLLASAAAAMQHEDESFSQCLANESRHHFIEYARVKQEKDENRFVDCIHGLVTVGFGDAALSDDTRRALAAYLGSTCLTPERCGVMPAVVVASLLEDLLEWCAITAVPTEAVIAPLEAALIARFRSSSITADAVESSEELAEAACRVVSLQHVSQDLRKVAAEVLGSAILRAEAAADVQRPVAKPSQSFEVVALSTAEQEHNHMNTVLRYCAALQQSGMAKHVEELMV